MEGRSTIAAPATGTGRRSALAIIRISGPKAFDITKKCLEEKERFAAAKARRIALFSFKSIGNGEIIDEVTAIKWFAPRSFTGENMVEIICHGGSAIVEEIMWELQKAGAEMAGKGEFTRRALENGKIDLLRAEAIRGMIESESAIEIRSARHLYGGGYAAAVERWREKLITVLSEIESNIEFSNEDDIKERASSRDFGIEKIAGEIEKELKKREKIAFIEMGLRLVIAGPPNAGKSTLFNYLIGKNRSIVDSEPGTTRDTVSERCRVGEWDLVIVDSAGMRDGAGRIEAEGMLRASEEIASAQIVIWVTASDEELQDKEREWIGALSKQKVICVINKIDIGDGRKKENQIVAENIPVIKISLKNEVNCEKVMDVVEKLVQKIMVDSELPDMIQNARHEEIVERMRNEIVSASEVYAPEIAAFYLQRALQCVEELVGHTASEETLDKIFSDFCIGK